VRQATAILVLNWNDADNTLACVNSILQHVKSSFTIFILDNASTDDSVNTMTRELEENGISVDVYTESAISNIQCKQDENVKIVVNDGNYGFAGGHNSILKWLFEHKCHDFIWYINSDAYLESDALQPLLRLFEDDGSIGCVGSVLVEAGNNRIIECYGGGKVYPLLGKSKLFLKGEELGQQAYPNNKSLDFIMGASMLYTLAAHADAGLMDEQYFLYYEEVDLQRTMQDKGWRLAVSPESVLYHKGASSTTNCGYLYYISRAAVIYSNKHYGKFAVIITLLFKSLILIKDSRLSYGDYLCGIRGLLDGLKGQRRAIMKTD